MAVLPGSSLLANSHGISRNGAGGLPECPFPNHPAHGSCPARDSRRCLPARDSTLVSDPVLVFPH